MRLSDSAAALARGDFDARVPVNSRDELGRLSEAFNDMAERLQSSYDTLERRVQERTAELSRTNRELRLSNRDLKQFAYIASHDLQEPLRAVSGFTELLRNEYGPQLDDKAREFMDFTVDGVRRMQLLIDNLLDYSRVEAQGRPFREIDSRDVLQQALRNLNEAIEESGASVTDEGLGSVVADESQLVRVFQNLIGNAIKFRGPSPPQIHVRSESRQQHVQFTICDNGIGIKSPDQERIFTIFQRLHSQEDYPGTGIGLAICQRIVERHGGRIWVESQSGQGSCFHFTLAQPPVPDALTESSVGKDDIS
jgi:light-regulated signal transduction histidine kinase (bacteriophytochrome)